MNKLYDAYLTLKGIKKYRDEFIFSQYYDVRQIKDYQKAKLRCLLVHCYESIPFYSERFRIFDVNPYSNDPFEELRKLPVLTKAEVRNEHDKFILSSAARKGLKLKTSGTTGEPFVAYTSFDQWVVEQACIWRQWKWAGYKFRDRIAIFRSYSPSQGESKVKMDRIRNWAYFSVFHMDDDSLAQYVEFLQRWQPKFLRGYPSSLRLLAEYVIRRKLKISGLKAAFVASEGYSDDFREVIREAFGVEVFDHYGQAEISCMFHDCEEHNGMHLDVEYGYVELIPSDDSPGLYRIISTNLHNTSMPLLRYDTGDISLGEWSYCSCNRSSPVIKKIFGRQDDYLLGLNLSKIPTVNLYTFFSGKKFIRRFQLIQSQAGKLEVYLAFWDSDTDNRELINNVKQELERYCGLQVVCQETSRWQMSSSGKFPTFIQKVKI